MWNTGVYIVEQNGICMMDGSTCPCDLHGNVGALFGPLDNGLVRDERAKVTGDPNTKGAIFLYQICIYNGLMLSASSALKNKGIFSSRACFVSMGRAKTHWPLYSFPRTCHTSYKKTIAWIATFHAIKSTFTSHRLR